jgi:hypothetical protein
LARTWLIRTPILQPGDNDPEDVPSSSPEKSDLGVPGERPGAPHDPAWQVNVSWCWTYRTAMTRRAKSAALPQELLLISGLLRSREGFEFGGHVGGLGHASSLEDLMRLP